jgi:hypothetical protein
MLVKVQEPTGVKSIKITEAANGLSAYQVAVKNGFVGDEAAWEASLKGDQGIQGEQGIQGVKGDIAIQGEYVSYPTLAAAQAVSPKPTNGTLFQVEDVGVFTFQSGSFGGTRFERTDINTLDVTGTKIVGKYVKSTGAILTLSTSDVTDYIPVKENDIVFFTGSTPTDQPSIAGYDANYQYVSSVLIGGDYQFKKAVIPVGISFIVGNGRNETRVPTPNYFVQVLKKDPVRNSVDILDENITRIEEDTLISINSFSSSKNISNPNNIVRGYFHTNGVITSSANTIRTGLIKVNPSTQYAISGIAITGASKRLVCFNAQGALIDSLNYNGSTSIIYQTPANAYEIGVNIVSVTGITDQEIEVYKNQFQVEEGLSVTGFEPYGDRLKEEAMPLSYQTSKLPKIKLIGISSTKFEVHSLTESGEYLIHPFEKVERAAEYDNGWAPSYIKHKGNDIIQGNYNWIHIINKTNESQHVGLLHGCETFIDIHFFIDGHEFLPTEIIGQTIEASEFSFNYYSTIYAADSAATTGGSNVVPQQPLVESTRHYVAAKIEGFNKIEWRNKLMILRDNTSFDKCYIAMLAGDYPYFDRVQYENIENTVNSMDNVNGVQAISPSTALINDYSFDTADGKRAELAHVARMWSTQYDYKVVQEVYNLNNSQQNKMHIQATNNATDFRKKLYWHPVITTTAAPRTSQGTADVFNTGDIIEGIIKRKITV